MNKITNLKISQDGRFITREDGSPFFWLADTAWELFHRLNREEAAEYLATRAWQKFTAIQAVALSEREGLTAPNAYGRTPLLKNKNGEYDPTLPDTEGGNSYWDHVDFIIDTAASLGLYIGLLPTWGDKFNTKWGGGPVIFNPENAFIYGKWIGNRYKDRSNIVWVLGGDRPLENDTHIQIVRRMAEGIKESTGGKHLATYHPSVISGAPSEEVRDEGWLDFSMIQSGHHAPHIANYESIQKYYAMTPPKPIIDGEPRYEGSPVCATANPSRNGELGYFDGYDVRVAAYWSMLSGSCGHTYGHHSVWIMHSGDNYNSEYFDRPGFFIMDWRKALHCPGAEVMRHVKELFLSRPFLELSPCQDMFVENYNGANYMPAARGKRYALIYSPNGLPIRVKMGIIEGSSVIACWFNPRNGKTTYNSIVKNDGVVTFTPPSQGRDNDWILVLDSVEIERLGEKD